MKIVLISDTHTFHDQITIPECDVLVHAGDLGLRGSVDEIQPALDWLNKQPAKHIVFVAGNHDFAFEQKKHFNLGRLIYLENSSANIAGVNFWGSPITPWFFDWAFNVQRGAAIKKYWDGIPDAGLVDVLITHGPPMGILDQAAPHKGSDHVGCEDLAKQVTISQPLTHVFGHIHGGYGSRKVGETTYYNASVVNEAYKVVNAPWVVEL